MIWTIIQARLGSTRLPRKVLHPFGDGLLIDAVVERASRLGPPVCLAIPVGDQELARYCIGHGWVYFEGSEDDVLSRYVEAAQQLKAEHVVRVTADCPFVDVEAGRWTIQEHLDSGADLTYYKAEGRGVEVFKREALEWSQEDVSQWRYQIKPYYQAGMTPPDAEWYREHPDEWILHHSDLYKVNEVKFSVDTADELDLARSRIGYKAGVRH